MPSHTHKYYRYNHWSYTNASLSGSCYDYPCRPDDNFERYTNVESTGGNQPHNNMPPYITAYCWRRYQ